jgi:putative ABC transport system permease protein
MTVDDLRYAVRRLAKQPAATVVSIVTLACAIGASVAAWSLLSAVLLHPLPVSAPDRLVVVGARWAPSAGAPGASGPLGNAHLYPLYPAVQASGVFEQAAAWGRDTLLVSEGGGTSTYHPVVFATYDLFDTIGVRLQAGRGFTAEDDRPGAPPVAILSDRFWRRAFHADPGVLGRNVIVRGQAVAIVGVAPAGFRGLDLTEAPDFYLPFHTVADVTGSSGWFTDPRLGTATAWVQIVGRLRPGADATTAAARLGALPPGPAVDGRVFGLTNVNTAALAERARPDMTRFARLLAVTVGLLLVIGCLTVGMLLLLRTEARRDEFAMCLALGATRSRLAVGIVCEGGLLSVAGSALALPMSAWLLAGVRAFQLPGRIDIDLLEISIDGWTLGALAGAALAATLAIAIVAGVFGFSANIADVLRARAGATPRIGRRRTRAALVVAQIAVAMVLLSGAGLFIRSLGAALSLNPGYATDRIATGDVSLLPYGYTKDRAMAFFDELRDRLSRSPLIQSVSMTLTPGGMGPGGYMVFDGERRRVPSYMPDDGVDERYFSTIGLSLVQGRDFTRDDHATAPRVAIVSASLGRFIAGNGSPVGHHILEAAQPPYSVEIVGVVPDVITSVRTLEPLVIYRPVAQKFDWQATWGRRTVVLRAASDVPAAMREAVATIKSMEPAIVQPQFTTIDDQLTQQMGPQRFGATVLGALGGIAALLTLFGIYVLAESMSVLRRREMGVRAALGATTRQLSSIVLAETTRLIARHSTRPV